MKSRRLWPCLVGFAIAVSAFGVGVSVRTASAAGELCCGPITAKGQQLQALLDGMDVENHWPAHEHVSVPRKCGVASLEIKNLGMGLDEGGDAGDAFADH